MYLIYKIKPFRTFDGQIIKVTQATKVDPKAKKKINELGYSVKSKKKGDRILTDMTRDFVVKYKNTTVDVSTSSLPHNERKRLWKIKNELIKVLEDHISKNPESQNNNNNDLNKINEEINQINHHIDSAEDHIERKESLIKSKISILRDLSVQMRERSKERREGKECR